MHNILAIWSLFGVVDINGEFRPRVDNLDSMVHMVRQVLASDLVALRIGVNLYNLLK